MEREFQLKRSHWGNLALALATTGLVTGCLTLRIPDELAAPAIESRAAPSSSTSPGRAEETKDTYAWYEATTENLDASEFTWRNDRLEEIAAAPNGSRELLKFVAQGDAAKSSGAIIQLARLEPGTRDVELERIAQLPSQPKTTQLAAIESLGRSPSNDATERLIRVGKSFCDEMPSNVAIMAQVADADRHLKAVIEALSARNVSLADFESCLSPTGPPLTCAALLADSARRKLSPLPSSAVACFEHPQMAVRMALLRWIEVVGDAETVGEVLKITRGGQGEIFFAAIKTLGSIRSSMTTARLDELARDQRPRVRGAAMAALIRQNSPAATQAAISETRWQVKQAIAEFLVEPASPAEWSYAETLLRDPAPAVSQTFDKTIARWSQPSQQRARLAALESPLPFVRQAHWLMLNQTHADLPEFDPQATPEQRSHQLSLVRQALEAPRSVEAPVIPANYVSTEALRREIQAWQSGNERSGKLAELKLLGIGGDLASKLDALGTRELRELPAPFWTSIVAVVDARFAAASGLRNADVTQRREAASQLARMQNSPPPISLLVWLEGLLAPEEDVQVWRQILPVAGRASHAEARAVAARIASLALRIDALDLRVAACGILERAPVHSETMVELESLLGSSGQTEVVAAIRVMRNAAEISAAAHKKLLALLDSPDATVRIYAAWLLSTQGDALGAKALTSAAMRGPDTERRLAIEKLGETGEEKHITLLIGLLDASPTLRQAALAALEKLAETAVIAAAEKPFMSSAEQASRWKSWYQEQQNNAKPRQEPKIQST